MHWILNRVEFVKDCDVIVTTNYLNGGDTNISILNSASYHESYLN
jgi:hypothetical protein